MNQYEQYKPSGVAWLGDVPKHWILTKIKYIAELTPSKSNITNVDKECSFVPMEKLKLGNISLDENRMINDVINSYTYFQNGDLLIAKVTPCFENKNFAIAENLTNGIGFGSSEIYVLRPKNCNVRYLFYRLQDNAFMELATGTMTGAGGLKRVPSDFLNNFILAMPSETEQTAIANFLDERTAYIDRLIAKQQALSEKLSEKRTALITEAVCGRLNTNAENLRDSGIQWLGKVPEHWEVKRLKFMATIQNGQDYKHIVAYEGYPVIGSGGQFAYATDYLYDGESILLGRKGTIDKPLYINGKFWTVDTMFYTQVNQNVVPKFLYYCTLTVDFWHIATQTALPSVTATALSNLQFTVPPLEEQTAIAHYLDKETAKIDRLQAKIAESVARLKEYRSALITQAVTGKIKV